MVTAFFQSTPVTVIMVLLALCFFVKSIAIAGKLWVPEHRKLTLDDEQLKGWRVLASVDALMTAAVWGGLLISTHIQEWEWGGMVLAIVGLVVSITAGWQTRKKYPYIDPATVKKSGKKKKKK